MYGVHLKSFEKRCTTKQITEKRLPDGISLGSLLLLLLLLKITTHSVIFASVSVWLAQICHCMKMHQCITLEIKMKQKERERMKRQSENCQNEIENWNRNRNWNKKRRKRMRLIFAWCCGGRFNGVFVILFLHLFLSISLFDFWFGPITFLSPLQYFAFALLSVVVALRFVLTLSCVFFFWT